jgi:hypothetical protein
MPRFAPALVAYAILALAPPLLAQLPDRDEPVEQPNKEKKVLAKPVDSRTPEQKNQDAKAAAAAGATILGMGVLMFVAVAVAGFLFYFLPSFIAMMRGHANLGPIIIVNFFLGWILVGWVVALAWAFSAQEQKYYRPRYRR